MPFSFNPGQTTTAGTAGWQAAPEAVASNVQQTPVQKSPILFIQQIGQEKTVNSYLQLLLILINILFIAAAVILFIYNFYLGSSVQSKKDELASKEVMFKDYPITEMKAVSSKATLLNQLLQGYVSVRSPLKFLENVVENQVVFDKFILSKGPSGGYIARFSAITSDYPSLIQQLGALNLTEYSKVAPTPKLDRFSEEKDNTLLVVDITTPVFVQGVLPDDVVFIPASSSTTPRTSSTTIPVGTSASGTPVGN